jgi:hypothetical protein
MKTVIAVTILALSARSARADDTDVGYLPMLMVPQVGIGFTGVVHEPEAAQGAFDGTLRLGYMFRDRDSILRPGGFLEVHTVGFDSCDFAFGPLLETRLEKSLALQLRAGVGAGPDVPAYAEAGVELGNGIAGLSFTGRREFDDGGYRISVNLEVTTALLLIPFITMPHFD